MLGLQKFAQHLCAGARLISQTGALEALLVPEAWCLFGSDLLDGTRVSAKDRTKGSGRPPSQIKAQAAEA